LSRNYPYGEFKPIFALFGAASDYPNRSLKMGQVISGMTQMGTPLYFGLFIKAYPV
jgi:hypothetical protein